MFFPGLLLDLPEGTPILKIFSPLIRVGAGERSEEGPTEGMEEGPGEHLEESGEHSDELDPSRDGKLSDKPVDSLEIADEITMGNMVGNMGKSEEKVFQDGGGVIFEMMGHTWGWFLGTSLRYNTLHNTFDPSPTKNTIPMSFSTQEKIYTANERIRKAVMYWPIVPVQHRDHFLERLREKVFGRVENKGRAVDPSLITRDDEAVEELAWIEPGRQTPERREALDNSGSTLSSYILHNAHPASMFQKPPSAHHRQTKAQCCLHARDFIKEGKEGSSVLVLPISTPFSWALKAILPPTHPPWPWDFWWSVPRPRSTSNQQGKGKGGGRDYQGCRRSAEKEHGGGVQVVQAGQVCLHHKQK
ncbi:hypothetical protein SERLADRAFT_405812 [Serpula lacrymans var. lacrymans S7.9]|uniref:Uncharacterized protein n=1 Tax=Serpula lacrymans var. lacrymans (strain S7.9) TaxID=578457 RepID=F8NL97_SERL9|nr:uncharacterized protein SERLADRAFT_405812 [Serpula lacrymans var. lacrymans S7.9]EGO28145.1 hypothetical protein SERLADRAFT_405812 [Serpula lacrymans var. lacrymans S7.9]